MHKSTEQENGQVIEAINVSGKEGKQRRTPCYHRITTVQRSNPIPFIRSTDDTILIALYLVRLSHPRKPEMQMGPTNDRYTPT